MKLCIFAIVLIAGASALLAEDKPPAPYAPMPWHLVDTWWDIGSDAPLESCSIEITISDDVPADVNLYLAPIGLGHLNKTPFYGGIQTQIDGYTKQDQRLRKLGPGLLFSMWGQRSLDAIRPSIGGFCQSSGHEGDFVSVRRPYPWKRGKYSYRIVRMDQEIVDGKPCTWVGALVHYPEQDENVYVGALRFPGEKLILSRQLANFVEIYGEQRPVSAIPKLTVTVGNLQVNGKPVEKPTAHAVYPPGVPDYAQATSRGKSIVITVGQPIANRTQRRVELIGQ
ncbi:MAG TPA: hypothetical protein VHV55_27560 [Pirellulales bacterium]|jgi:hypothetical protein|nr:hypothetical protein [Pirellulales bacterium]